MHDFEPVDFGQYTRHDSGLFVPMPQESPQDHLPGHLRYAIPEQPGGYDYFRHPRGRDDLYRMAQETAHYIEENDIKAVVMVDRSARPFATAVKTYWDLSHQEEPADAPDIYFVNPNVDTGGLTSLISHRGAKAKFKNEHPFLAEHKDDPVLIMDTCVHTGDTIKPLLKTFKDAGFKDVRFGVATEDRNRSGVTPDVVLIEGEAYDLCYPFGHEFSVETGGGSLVSEPTKTAVELDLASRVQRHTNDLRQEIKRVICEGFVTEKTGVSFDRYTMPREMASSPIGRLVSMLLEF